MRNPYKAQSMLVINGKTTPLCMTLGALAALESAVGADHLPQLLERFASAQYRASDLILVLNAGLYGAGEDADIEKQSIEGGALAALRASRELLLTAFPNDQQQFSI